MDHSYLRQEPTDHRLLVLQRQHRSHAVWEANGKRPDDCATLVVHRSEQNLRKLPPLSQSVIELISQAGFGALLDMPFMRLDLGLLTALVERWRPETHTFHFPSGEATVTLQDVEVLTGLPINGKPVIGKTDLPWGQLVEQLLGRKLPEEMRRGNKVSMAWLRQHFPGRVLDGATQAQIEQQARGYILHLIGGILAPDTTSYVHLCYLKLLEDLEVAGQYSWGSACLASLYRYLCHVSEAKNQDVGGMFVLLQVWAWERLPYLAPGRLGERPPRDGAALIGRWDDDFHSPDLATHVVGHYRHALDMQRPDEVVWQPYSEELIESLPPFCRAGRAIWRAKVPLINFAVVEMHQPERVMRQFGFRQLVPPQSQARNALHGRTLKKGPQDWEVTNGAAVALWNNRLQLVEPEGIPDLLHVYPAGDDYVVWYESITVRYVSQMSAAMDKATRLFRSLIRPDLPEEAQAIGKQGLVCMAAQEKFLRKEPPVHLVFKPEEGGEDQANFEPAVEGPIPQQKAHAHEEEVVYELQAQPLAEAQAQDSPLPVQGGAPSTEAEVSPTSVSTSYASPLQIQNPCGSPLGPFSKSHMFTHDVTGSSLQPGSPSETPADTVKANIIVLPVSGADSTLDDRPVVKRSVETTIDDLVTTHHTSMPESTPPHPTIVSHVSYEVEDAMVEDEVLTRVQGDRGIGGEGVGEGEDHGQREIFLDAPLGRDNLEVEGRDNREVEGDQVGEEGVGHVTWDRERELGGEGVTTVWNVSHHISWPSDSILTQSWVISLLNAFDWGSKYLPPSEFSLLLPIHVFDNLVTSASKILRKEPNCITIDGLGANSSVVVVGDIHGQLHDLIFLLLDAGFLEDDKVFVFNGDYVDRGAWGLETFLLLLAWKVSMPDKVYLLRGNHESKKCTSVYGFKKEVLTKYGDKGNQVYEKCIGCFKELPLASIIAGCVYTTHGGLFRCVATATSKRSKRRKTHKAEASSLALGSLEDLSKARRAVLDPQWKGSNLVLGDVLWSDPSMSLGLSSNEERGIGLLWGPDCTEEFLKKSNLKLIIRSHEGPDAREKRPGLGGMEEGYTIDHVVESGKLITLFSAPDYPQFQATEERYKNKGAYIVLVPPHFDSPVFHSFEAVTPRPKANPYYDYEDVIDSGEELDFESMG